MKKFTILIMFLAIAFGGVLSCITVQAASNSSFSSSFKKNFKDCDTYDETFTSEHKGEEFKITRKILGWRNGFCRYEEIYARKEDSYKLNCALSDVQVDELYEAMRNRSKEILKQEVEIFAEEKDPKTGAIKYVPTEMTLIKGNKATVTWAKYLNNPYFCRPQKLK